MCAGLIGYRALKLAGEAGSIGIYGFGAAAHLLTQVANFDNRNVFAFTRPGDVLRSTPAYTCLKRKRGMNRARHRIEMVPEPGSVYSLPVYHGVRANATEGT